MTKRTKNPIHWFSRRGTAASRTTSVATRACSWSSWHRGDYWDMKDGSLVQVFKLAAAAMTRTRADDVATHRRFRR